MYTFSLIFSLHRPFPDSPMDSFSFRSPVQIRPSSGNCKRVSDELFTCTSVLMCHAKHWIRICVWLGTDLIWMTFTNGLYPERRRRWYTKRNIGTLSSTIPTRSNKDHSRTSFTETFNLQAFHWNQKLNWPTNDSYYVWLLKIIVHKNT